MVKLIPILAFLVFFSACASMQTDLTPNQRLYALIAEYNAIEELAADYCESPGAIPTVKSAIKDIDAKASKVIKTSSSGVFTAQQIIDSLEPHIKALKAELREVWNE